MGKKKDFMDLNKELDKILKENEDKIVNEYGIAIADIKKVLAEAFENYSNKDGILTREEMVKFGRLAKLEKFLIEQIQKLTKNQISLTQSAMATMFVASYYRYGYFIEKQVELSIYKTLTSKVVTQMILNPLDLIKWDERVKENTTTLVRQLREILVTGLAQGQSLPKMSRQVTERLNIGANKAKRIVRTECRRVQEQANLQTMEEAQTRGVITKKMWVSTLDTRTRDTHKHLDGQKVEIDGEFKSRSGFTAKAPHQFGVPHEDINCRCTMIAFIEGLDPKTRVARDKDGKNKIIPYQTYQEWFKDLESR